MTILALTLLIVFALIALTGVILSLAASLRPIPRLPFPTVPLNDFFQLVRILTMTNTLWHPGRGDLPDPSGEAPAPEFPNHPME